MSDLCFLCERAPVTYPGSGMCDPCHQEQADLEWRAWTEMREKGEKRQMGKPQDHQDHRRWEEMLKGWEGISPRPFLDGCAAAGDALFMAWLWWDACYPEMNATPADLIATARLMLDHTHHLEKLP